MLEHACVIISSNVLTAFEVTSSNIGRVSIVLNTIIYGASAKTIVLQEEAILYVCLSVLE